MISVSGGGSVIKSIQRGSATVPVSGVLDIFISPVEPAKSVLIVTGGSFAANPSVGVSVSGDLVGGNKIEAYLVYPPENNNGRNGDISWQVIEYV